MKHEVLYQIPAVEHGAAVRTVLFQSMRWMPATQIADYLAFTNLTFEEICDALILLIQLHIAERRTTTTGTEIYRIVL